MRAQGLRVNIKEKRKEEEEEDVFYIEIQGISVSFCWLDLPHAPLPLEMPFAEIHFARSALKSNNASLLLRVKRPSSSSSPPQTRSKKRKREDSSSSDPPPKKQKKDQEYEHEQKVMHALQAKYENTVPDVFVVVLKMLQERLAAYDISVKMEKSKNGDHCVYFAVSCKEDGITTFSSTFFQEIQETAALYNVSVHRLLCESSAGCLTIMLKVTQEVIAQRLQANDQLSL